MESRFGKYRILAELGQGGMADVFLGVAEGAAGARKLQVIKRLRDQLSEDPDFVTMLMDEGNLAVRLNHPNVVQTNEVGVFEGQHYITMEFLEGQPLSRLLLRHRDAFTDAQLYLVVADTLAGLHHAHELCDFDGSPLKIVHRDVTPQNVFVTYDGAVKVLDFGVAKAAGRAVETRAGVVKGKLRYMAPEQALVRPVDRRADVFAAGMLLWEIATRQRMWHALDEPQIYGMLFDGDIPSSPRAIRPEVPEGIDLICRKALSVDPADRHATAEAMREEIERHLEASGQLYEARRTLGPTMNQVFKDKRARVASVIQKQLMSLNASLVDVSASFAPVTLVESRNRSGPNRSGPSGIHGLTPPPMMASLPPAHHPHAGHRGSGEPLVVVTPLGPARPSPVRLLAIMGGILAAAITVAGLLTVVLLMRRPGRPAEGTVTGSSPPPLSATVAAPQAPPSSPLSETVSVSIATTPPDATVTFDGLLLSGSPPRIKVQADVREHVVTVQAPGHVTRTVPVVPSKNVELVVALERQKPGVAANARPGQVVHDRPHLAGPDPAASAPAAALSATPGKKTRNLDQTTDPWQK